MLDIRARNFLISDYYLDTRATVLISGGGRLEKMCSSKRGLVRTAVWADMTTSVSVMAITRPVRD